MLVFSCPKCLNNDLRSSLKKSGKTDSLECTSCGTNYPIIDEIDFEEVNVFYGDNGIVGRAKRPL